jgi:hypothetical protein
VKAWAGPRLVRADRKSAAEDQVISPVVLAQAQVRATVTENAEASRIAPEGLA